MRLIGSLIAAAPLLTILLGAVTYVRTVHRLDQFCEQQPPVGAMVDLAAFIVVADARNLDATLWGKNEADQRRLHALIDALRPRLQHPRHVLALRARYDAASSIEATGHWMMSHHWCRVEFDGAMRVTAKRRGSMG